MSGNDENKPMLDPRQIDDQLYLRMKDVHHQLCDVRALLATIKQSLPETEPFDDSDPDCAGAYSRITLRLTILIVMVDSAINELREIFDFEPPRKRRVYRPQK
jgi:hypothetical protein